VQVILLIIATLMAGGQDARVLEPGAVVERELAPKGEHRYRLAMTAGECVSVSVEQRGVDVVVQTRDADDRVIADFQDVVRDQGTEQVDLVADAGGTYTFAITVAPGTVPSGSYVIRFITRRLATDADRTMQEARRARTAALRLQDQSRLSEARSQFERALSLTEGVRGPQDVQVADVIAQLANLYLEVPDTAKAGALFERAIAIMDATRGSEHPATAFARARLASVYELTDQRPKAEAVMRQALEVLERTVGPEHPWTVRALGTLAALRGDAGDFDQQQQILERARVALDKTGYTDSMLYAAVLNNLGDSNNRQHEYARAEEYLQRALALGEKLRGPEALFLTNPLINLGVIARQRRDYAASEAYYARALAIRERIAGPDSQDLGLVINNLANVYHATGDYRRSLDTHFRALRISEKASGPYHRNTLRSVGNIARTYAAAGDIANAILFQRRADQIIDMQLALNLSAGSERQKLTFARTLAERTDRTISLDLHEARDNPDASSLAALALLRRKGRVLDAMIDTFAIARQRADARDQQLMDQLHSTTAHLARVALDAPVESRADERERQLRELEAQKERFEAELSEHSAELRAQLQPVTLDAVQAAIPEDSVLVEFAVYRPFNPKADRDADMSGPPHYAAYVIRRHGAPHGQDLGTTQAIDEAIDAFRQALRDPRRRDVQRRARALDEQVLRPLRASLGEATRLLIAPDGELNLVPFDALVDERGRYLIEHYAMSYLTSGRDLLRMQVPRESRGAPVIIADPFFGEPTPGPNVARTAVYFTPIAGTAVEARAIKAMFPESTLLTGQRATKSAIEQLEGPRMLHIASHGFFLRAASASAAPAPAVSGLRALSARVDIENPLLRSGVALAGANLTHHAEDDGILTAFEVSSLNLWGTKLVTLSACDTAIGEVKNGEGVYGLRRAFVLAGAETVVMTLWPVSDFATRDPMTAYYAGLRAGLGRGDALRQAKLAMLKRKDRRHPFFWASFIQSGEWARLDGTR
jgi:CHAT domain-containing protein